MNRLAFCLECRSKQLYTVQSSREKLIVRGTEFEYTELRAFCTSCGEEVYVPEINDANCDARLRAWEGRKG